ncbi:MAG: class I SAM-dependent methyltransferase [Saprospiraceae bacterium]|nr:class I SAM-dependent methyltransferase [Lewinella sp.]
MSNTFDRIRAYYDQFDEWSRLDAPSGIIEKEEVLHIVSSYIPSGAHILDLGAGPGRYAIEFAKMGYSLTLADLSERLIELAKTEFTKASLMDAVEGFHVANATDLDMFNSNRFDAVFCCGPFYHIVEAKSRIAAAREAIRVCKPDGVLIIGFIPRFSGLAGLLFRAANRDDQVNSAVFKRLAEEGVFHNAGSEGFQEGYYPKVEEMELFWGDQGLSGIEVFSTRSFMHQNEQHLISIRDKDPELFEAIINAHRRVATLPAFIEAGGHALLVGKKSQFRY